MVCWQWIVRIRCASVSNSGFRACGLLLIPLVVLAACILTGCGGYAARRIVEAPNRYPTWLAPSARVVLAYDGTITSNFPSQYLEVGPPAAKLRYRVVPPADYQFHAHSTNVLEHGRELFEFSFKAQLPGKTNGFTASPRGTVVLLHGYGLGGFAMTPWALQLAQDGWQCVLVDLRGHGRSTGKQIYYGIRESRDMTQLLDQLERVRQLPKPVAAIGVSYGAALALRWKGDDPRVGPIVAVVPYAILSNAVVNICREYAPLMPLAFPRAGLKLVPGELGVAASDLDPLTVVRRHPVRCLLITSDGDKVTSPEDMRRLSDALAPNSRVAVVLNSTHETAAYQFGDVIPLVQDWLDQDSTGDDKTAWMR
jgi:pimeloyl-ACP methyl ester carboxylesterase